MTDYAQEQEMEIEALEAILMDDFKEIDYSESGLGTKNRCFQIVLIPQDDDLDESNYNPVELALIFSHTDKYPDEPPLLNVKSVRGVKNDDVKMLKEKLEQEDLQKLSKPSHSRKASKGSSVAFKFLACENLGMAMVYTLVTSAKEWLSEKFGQEDAEEDSEEADKEKDDIIIPHGEPVTVETFLAWRERFEAELALERAKLMPESALTAPKEKKLSGRQWFESGRAAVKSAAAAADGSEEEEEEDVDFDDDDFEDDEDDMLEHYLAEKSEGSKK
ncbi:RWD domain-containing protein 1 [Iris pallida]|uniref:RWD domain-containing protein 1 n=1 Tax=Iris pallida TaxID=29817 RepID=A0AAX6EGK0_IRIPA|nr:RWD domain-containing protein 1 [Iris pallida]